MSSFADRLQDQIDEPATEAERLQREQLVKDLTRDAIARDFMGWANGPLKDVVEEANRVTKGTPTLTLDIEPIPPPRVQISARSTKESASDIADASVVVDVSDDGFEIRQSSLARGSNAVPTISSDRTVLTREYAEQVVLAVHRRARGL